ncbi:MAG: DUF559 domain-containing protein [Planctomycetia bacterium]|nr:DUF559 domain-containing protein [Planctomycetia bacterium]
MEKANKQNNYLYNSNLNDKARSLRKNMTKAEVALWKYALKNKKMLGYKFNRQRPVLNYIVDFMCKDLMIVIEIDGYSHNFKEVVKKDEIKQYDLENAGFTVLRYNDEDILENMESVLLDIELHITSLCKVYKKI